MYSELVQRLREIHPEEFGDKWDFAFACQQAMHEAADAIEELIRRETPMRVRITTSTKRCPSCNKQVSGIGNIHGNYRFCRWCGQALDWTEPPKEVDV